MFGGTLGGPIVRNKLFFFVSDETTRQRTFNGNAQGQTGTSGFVSLPPADLRRGDFSQTGTPIYDPLTGNPATAAGRVPFAFANCPGVTTTTDPRFASCNFIPANRINPIAAAMLSKLVLPTQAGFTNNYFVVNGYDTTYHKIDAKLTFNPGPRLNLNGRLGFLPSWERSLGILPSVDGSPTNPLSQGRVWDSFVDSHSIGATSILSQNFVVDGSFGYTKHNVHVFPPVDTCYGDVFGIRNACQPPYSLDTNVPDMNVAGWHAERPEPDSRLRRSAVAARRERGLDEGLAQREVRHRLHHPLPGPLRDAGAGVRVQRRRHDAQRRGQPVQPVRVVSARHAVIPHRAGHDAHARRRRLRSKSPKLRHTQRVPAEHAPEQQHRRLPPRSVEHHAEDHGVGRAAMGVLLRCRAAPITASRCTTSPRTGCSSAASDPTRRTAASKWRRISSRRGSASRIARWRISSSAPGIRGIPQSNNPGRQQMVPSQSFPQTIVITEEAPNNVTAVGSLNDGATRVIPADQSSGVLVLPRGAGVNTYRDEFVRGKISSWNVSMQKALGTRMSVTVAYVANRQNGMLRNRNLNYGPLGGGYASLPFFPLGITSAMNVFSPDGKVKYDSLQLSVNRRLSDGIQFTGAYTFAKTIDWWRTGIPLPEYWHLNKGETGSPAPPERLVDV